MKSLLILSLCALFSFPVFAQFGGVGPDYTHNEVNYNIANTLIMGSVEVGYEYFFKYNQSLGGKLLINDGRSYGSERHGRKYNTNSIRLNYTYYFGENYQGSEFYVRPFIKYRFGNFKDRVENGRGEVERRTTNMDTVILGIGAGYYWAFGDSFAIGPFVNIGRDFAHDVRKRFSSIEYNAGLDIAYRF